mmetsp:Transcript_18890/g.48160  ORF Transcript_18890/g.48160 Transcript_18890/m.48160 type:complete len:249 (-) Transcript_18890:1550-2296(-)
MPALAEFGTPDAEAELGTRRPSEERSRAGSAARTKRSRARISGRSDGGGVSASPALSKKAKSTAACAKVPGGSSPPSSPPSSPSSVYSPSSAHSPSCSRVSTCASSAAYASISALSGLAPHGEHWRRLLSGEPRTRRLSLARPSSCCRGARGHTARARSAMSSWLQTWLKHSSLRKPSRSLRKSQLPPSASFASAGLRSARAIARESNGGSASAGASADAPRVAPTARRSMSSTASREASCSSAGGLR